MNKNTLLYVLTVILCALCGLMLCAAQTSIIPHYLNDAIFVPDLLLCFTLVLGVFAPPAFGALFGIYAGVLADSTGGFGIYLLPLFYMLCGYGSHVCTELLPNKKFPVFIAVGTFACIGRAVVAVIYVMLSSGSVPLLDVGRYVCIPLFFGTLIALPVLYPVGWLLTVPIRKIKHQTIDKII